MLQASGGVWKGDSWGTQRVGGLTEAQIREELQNSGVDEIPLSVRNASNTISWWRGRQAVLDLKVSFTFSTEAGPQKDFLSKMLRFFPCPSHALKGLLLVQS